MGIVQTAAIALAVSFSCGAKTDTTPAQALRTAFVFGCAHVVMFAAGWITGAWFRILYRDHIFISIAYFTAFLLMAGAGVHMIAASSSHKRQRDRRLKRSALVISLAFAAALDAFIVGIGLAILFKPVGLTVFVLGIFAFFMSFAGSLTGDKSGRSFKENSAAPGGEIMTAVGLWVLASSFL